MTDENIYLNTIKQSALEMLDRLRYLDPDERFTLLEEYGYWWFMDIDLEDELFVPDWEKVKREVI